MCDVRRFKTKKTDNYPAKTIITAAAKPGVPRPAKNVKGERQVVS